MKIEITTGDVMFKDLHLGDMFLLDGNVGMKIKVPSNPQPEAVGLASGIRMECFDDTKVIRVDGTLKVEIKR